MEIKGRDKSTTDTNNNCRRASKLNKHEVINDNTK